MLKTVPDATCTFCGCVCDDIDLVVEAGRIVEAKNACALGKAWFLSHFDEDRPACTMEGRPVPLEEGIDIAARILTQARYPVVFGLIDTTCEAQGKAAAIADWIGGTVDTSTSACHDSPGMALQSVGEVTATLGEIRHRADLVVYWGADPVESHPRHCIRYTLMPRGQLVPRGREDRTCVVIDVRKTSSAEAADIFVPIKPGKDFEALWTLRALAKGFVPDAAGVEAETGVPLAAWQDLMARMKRARYGVLFFGMGLTMTRGEHLNCEAALALARDLNDFTRFVCMPMRGRGNAAGADNVLSWRTGYPFGVNLSRGYPRFNPGEYTATDILSRREADAALIVSADPMANFCQPAREHLASIPYIALDPKETATTRQATVAFTAAPYGISAPGTVYRMDDVPLPLRPALSSPYPSDYDILSRLEDRIRRTAERDGLETRPTEIPLSRLLTHISDCLK